MKTHFWPVCGMVVAASGFLAGQQNNITGPLAGFVFDPSARLVRPIRGVPGASTLGDAVSFGLDLTSVWVSPGQDSAIAVGTDQSLHLFRLNGSTPVEVSLGGISGAPDMVVFSPSGKAAALFAGDGARVLTGLPNAPTLAGAVKALPVMQSMSGAFSFHTFRPSIALSDDGAYLLTVYEGSAHLRSLLGLNRRLMAAQDGAQVAFAAGGHDAAVVDAVTGLTLIHDAAGNAVTQLLAPPDDRLAGPAGLAFSTDKQTLYVASAPAKSVAAFNLAAASRIDIDCACTPATLIPMGNVFRLTESSAGPLWLLDSAANPPRTVFVPARGE